MLTHEPKGCCSQLVCQYHGWEFGKAGETRKIPDATSFRPMTRGELGLTRFRTETCGQLIFVNFNEEGPSLKEFLGHGYDVGEELFGAGHRQILALDYKLDTNWKMKIENSLESYHVDMVHQATFIKTPGAAECEHALEPRWTSFATIQAAGKRLDRILDRIIHHVARIECDDKYRHYHFYPSMMYGKMRLFSFAETVFPIAPDRTRIFARFFANPGTDRWQTRLLFRGMRAWGRKFWPTVQAEDAAVLPDIQKGMDCGQFPSEGLLSIREERLFHFQQYIHDYTSNGHASELVPAAVSHS
jgi:phenylpropionate dioxygenase-like ring-hydroxylating dioxygenase large terminal subunit